MTTDRFADFRKFVEKELLPATGDLERLADANRKHVQKLVYTNLVDRFDAMVDGAILENCRQEHLVSEALKGMTQPFTEADALRLLMQGESVQDSIDARLKDVLRAAVLRQRHSKKLSTLFKVLKPEEDCWNKPRVNTATGQILEQITPQQRTVPYSVCGMPTGCIREETPSCMAEAARNCWTTTSTRSLHSSSAGRREH